MSGLNPKLPVRYKKLQHTWAVSFEFENRDPAITYYLRMKVLEEAFKLDKAQGKAQNPAENFPVLEVMDYLEAAKKGGSIGSEDEAYQQFEVKAAQLLGAAEKLDHDMKYDRKIVKLYFTASILFDSMSIFRNYDGRHADKSKFVKWRSTYIATEMKAGRVPEPPAMNVEEDELAELEAELKALDNAPSGLNVPPVGTVPSVNRGQKPQVHNPYPNVNALPSNPPAASPRQAPTQQPSRPRAQPQPQAPMQPQRPAQPQAQPQVAPTPSFTPQAVPSGQLRKLTVAEKKQVKDMVGLVSSCLTYDDTAGAIQCCNNAIQFMMTGQLPQ